MRATLAATLLLAAPAAALQPLARATALFRGPAWSTRSPAARAPASMKLFGFIRSKAYVEVFDGVRLPLDEPLTGKIGAILDLNFYTVRKAIFQYALPGKKNSDALVGKAKTEDSLTPLREHAEKIATGIGGQSGLSAPVEGYKLWGNGDYAEILKHLLVTNPFMASALTKTADGFELKAFDDKEAKPSLFLRLMRTITDKGEAASGARVNFKFDSNMEITTVEVFDKATGQRVDAREGVRYWASGAIYNLAFYASAVHGTIHVFHYLLTSALSVTSRGFRPLNKFAEIFDDNIGNKYLQVFALLINRDKPDAIVSGPNGFGSSQAGRSILKDMLLGWARCTSAQDWLDMMFDPEVLAADSIVAEFKKHTALIPGFAADSAAALKEIDPAKFAAAQDRLNAYLKKCGDFGWAPCKITTVQSWLELMSVTGIFHGSTLSYTRVIASADVMRWRRIDEPLWDTQDIGLANTGLGTIIGMENERHVMTSTVAERKLHPKLFAVLREYDAQSTKLKQDYEAAIQQNLDLFKNFGFILSDFCTDTFDGKQLTIATYI